MKAGELDTRSNRRRLMVIGLVLVLIAIIGVVAVFYPKEEKRLMPTLPASVDTDLATTKRSDIPRVIAYLYNVRYDDLKNKPLDGQVKDFGMAMALSLAFDRDENPKKAFESYTVADKRKSKTDDTLDFRTGYCRAAYEVGDDDEAKKQCDLAKQKLSSITDTDMRGQASSKIDAIKLSYEEQS